MQREEMRDAGSLAGRLLDEVAVVTRDVHHAISGRVFGLLGAPAVGVRLVHDGISALTYTAVRAGVSTIAPLTGQLAAAAARQGLPTYENAAGRFALAAVNGILGDQVAAEMPALATELAIRTHAGHRHHDVPSLIDDLGTPSRRLAFFVHGLCEHDSSWWQKARRHWGDPDVTYGSMLARDRGVTPLYLAYNSGLRISANGRAIADLIDDVVAHWPVPVEEITLVGHSMGGLVIRSAAHVAQQDGQRWAESVRHIVCLGTPHHGAPLERIVNAGTHLMWALPETRPFARLLNLRSVGIKDLRYGAVLDADWIGTEPDEFLRDRRTEVPFLAHAQHYYVGVTLTRSKDGLLAHLLGDLLVQFPSASGEGPRRLPFELDHGLHLGGLNHFDLLNNPDVYAQLSRWFTAPASVA